jgi:adenylylsulfate kinase
MVSEHKNIVWQKSIVTQAERAGLKKQRATVLWFTGYSGSGKSTIATALDLALYEDGRHTYVLDGDNIRMGLNKDLSFSASDRTENIRRIGEVSKLFLDAGLIVMCAFISPFLADRSLVRKHFSVGDFVEIFMDASLAECEKRDPKGLYARARAGHIAGFTGIDSPYEPPISPDIHLDSANISIDECVNQIITYLERNGRLLNE